jgi:hypothetical protein
MLNFLFVYTNIINFKNTILNLKKFTSIVEILELNLVFLQLIIKFKIFKFF